MTASEHARIFGPREPSAPGRSRLCKTCGDWHRLDRPWPHNCRPPAPPRSVLPAPMLAPKFQEFVAGDVFNPVPISDPASKREYMERHDLVEWDAGVKPDREPTEREWERDLAMDLKREAEIDPLNRPPVDVVGRTNLDGASEIETTDMEVFK